MLVWSEAPIEDVNARDVLMVARPDDDAGNVRAAVVVERLRAARRGLNGWHVWIADDERPLWFPLSAPVLCRRAASTRDAGDR
jgi:hypothetical protein